MKKKKQKKTSDLENPQKCVDRLSSPCRGAQSPVMYQCICQGLSNTFGSLNGQWHVFGCRDKSSHDHFRTEGFVSCNKGFSISPSKQEGSSCFRQCHSSALSQQTRWGLLRNVSDGLASNGFCNTRAIFLRARHIQGCLSVISDSLSCRDKIIYTEWSLHPKVFHMVCQIWHKPMVDMFATKLNKLPLYISPVPDPNAISVDALNILWEALDGYVYCPIALIPKAIQKMRTYACQMIVVAPGWPGMSWFWDLIDLFTKPPLLLPLSENLLKQPFCSSHRFHQNLSYVNLHFWHLDLRPNYLKTSQSQWQIDLRHLRDFHQEETRNQGGPFWNQGARRVSWTSKNLLSPQ